MKNIKPIGTSLKGYFIFHIAIMLLSLTSGCGNKFFDPSQVGRFDHTPAVNVILEKLGPTEEIPVAWEQGEEPRARDTVAIKADYALMPGDIIEIEIHELLSQSQTYVKNYEVSETGLISVPVVGEIMAKGNTERQLEEIIRNRLYPETLINPIVNVTFLQSQHRVFSIQGDGIREPNRYPILKNDWRLMDSLAQARGLISQQNVSFVYVTRRVPKNSMVSKNDNRDYRAINSQYNLKEPITLESRDQTQVANNSRISQVVVSSSEMVVDNRRRSRNRYTYPTKGRLASTNTFQFSDMPGGSDRLENRISVDEVLKRVTGRSVEITEEPENRNAPQPNNTRRPEVNTTSPQDTEHIEWVFQNGEWVAVKVEPSSSSNRYPEENVNQRNGMTTLPESVTNAPEDEYEWVLQGNKWVPVKPGQNSNNTGVIAQAGNETSNQDLAWNNEYETETRLIKIPVDKLLAGDERYNIVIKPGDSIHVPVDVSGVYYLMGNLNRTGAVEMTGGLVTLKQAVATGGGIGPLGWPKRCEITRRIGRNKEEIVRVDLEKIFNGEQPDIYIKPHDIINVGTHATSIWRAVLRNSFRATYGFGFVYDRNFANDEYYSSRWFD